ncbi:MAG: hypothetical protein J2P17_27445 [Mycobacterium sp.]|nr:hypothetical protein [Mycobacterium sp.]
MAFFVKNPNRAELIRFMPGDIPADFQVALDQVFGGFNVTTLPDYGDSVAIVIPTSLQQGYPVNPGQWFGLDEFNNYVVFDDSYVQSQYTEVT